MPASRIADAEKFFEAASRISAAIIATDARSPDQPIVFCNDAFLHLVGYGRDEVMGLNPRFMQGAATDAAAVAELSAAIRERRTVSVEILNYRKDGSPFWNAVSMSPVFSDNGELFYFIAALVDVTARRAFESGYRRAQKMEAVTQLTAGLAHDLNNLLHVISGNLEFARRAAGEDAALAARLDNAAKASARAAKLTRQLLTFSRHVQLEPVFLDLHEWLRRVHDLFDGKLGSQVRLRLELESGEARCFVDPVHLEMAVLNTLLNARDALPQGGEVCLTTSVREVNGENGEALQPGKYVVLSIVDKGHGMPEHVRRRATDPFFTTKPLGRGTGLGLAMVRSFARQSGGELEIESVSGEGTTVRIVLPMEAGAARSSPPPADDHHSMPAPDLPARLALILGEGEAASMVQDHLEHGGYSTRSARDVDEAMALLNREQRGADLVLVGNVSAQLAQDAADRVREVCPDTPVLTLQELGVSLEEGSPASDPRHGALMDRLNGALNRRDGGRCGPVPS